MRFSQGGEMVVKPPVSQALPLMKLVAQIMNLQVPLMIFFLRSPTKLRGLGCRVTYPKPLSNPINLNSECKPYSGAEEPQTTVEMALSEAASSRDEGLEGFGVQGFRL